MRGMCLYDSKLDDAEIKHGSVAHRFAFSAIGLTSRTRWFKKLPGSPSILMCAVD